VIKHHILWGVALFVLVVFAGIALSNRHRGEAGKGGGDERPLEGLNNFGAVPDFSLIERSGKRLGLSDLKGMTWIVDFVYTRCKDTCPLQSAQMAKLQADLGNNSNLKLVSISVDPEWDSPKVLSQYAERFKADPERWFFLTGDKKSIYRLAQEGFRLSAVPASDGAEDVFIHSSQFVLVDKQRQIRGYYDSQDPEALRRLKKDAAKLLTGKKE
jgi:protein SCO1/2